MAYWTQERTEFALTKWKEGESATIIAAQLGDVTRNAVIGKMHRMGASGRAQPNRRPRSRTKRRMPKVSMRPPPKPKSGFAAFLAQQKADGIPPLVEVPFIPPEERKKLLDLEPNDCRWPIGDGPFEFCARKKVKGLSYCADHARCAYRAPTPYQRRTGELCLIRGAPQGDITKNLKEFETA